MRDLDLIVLYVKRLGELQTNNPEYARIPEYVRLHRRALETFNQIDERSKNLVFQHNELTASKNAAVADYRVAQVLMNGYF